MMRESGQMGSSGATCSEAVFEQFRMKHKDTLPGLAMKESTKIQRHQKLNNAFMFHGKKNW